ncbi:MAG: Crp/Fnr family transcriptional regulator [Sphingomonas sp.]|jgi:CRP-like cAMP-binding protein|uniref:Crp/Fnr family transcriptional regulator n=1 Tax=Sphingomonas sp. TaxID=28214 RepID=UPI0025F752C0|nr:Crp/Fnr family transcriptional regulator [Sphingomonas sp.]MBX9881749.1 Crp/Fnr family transcriptional regulator [Sphingomonas sp.]
MLGRNGEPWQALRANHLLAGLAPQDALLIAPHLRRRTLPPGPLDLVEDGRARVLFPESAVIGAAIGGKAETALIGREGLAGWPLFGAEQPVRLTVRLSGGSVLSISAARLEAATLASPSLFASLIAHSQRFLAQTGALLASGLRDSAAQRLARWLVMLHDRIEGDTLAITHQELSEMLCLRRSSVTEALHLLEGERALRCTRGRITVRDGAVLRAWAAGEPLPAPPPMAPVRLPLMFATRQ